MTGVPHRRTRVGLGLVLAGLAVQAGAAFAWTPGTFILLAVVGVPLVLAGAVVTWLSLRGASRSEGP
jgi:hypothetical protein